MRISVQELKKRRDEAYEILKSCTLCPRLCKIDRTIGKKGICCAGLKAKVYSFMPHHGEEPVISGKKGSGTVFFSNCHMKCVYCQNYLFSQSGEGKEISNERLAQIMLDLELMGCHNINLVSPTHYLAQILDALCIAVKKGLKIPIVYNTGGYESVNTLKILDGIVDIYLVDMRYADDKIAEKYSLVKNYANVNQSAVKEMLRQTGIKGLIIRHLVLPEGLAGTERIMDFIANELSKECFISLMSQYYPTYKACEYSEINRRITKKEYETAIEAVEKSGLKNGWFQPEISADVTEKFIGENFKGNV